MAAVDFVLSCQTQMGDRVFVVGSHPDLGAWDPAASKVELHTAGASYPSWSGKWKCSDPSMWRHAEVQHYFKFVVFLACGAVRWEDSIENRKLHVSLQSKMCAEFDRLQASPSIEWNGVDMQSSLPGHDEEVSPKGVSAVEAVPVLPLAMMTAVRFVLSCQTQMGDRVFVVGSHPDLGAWDPAASKVELHTDAASYPLWSSKWECGSTTHYFKFVVLLTCGAVRWEDSIENRKLQVSLQDEVYAEFGRMQASPSIEWNSGSEPQATLPAIMTSPRRTPRELPAIITSPQTPREAPAIITSPRNASVAESAEDWATGNESSHSADSTAKLDSPGTDSTVSGFFEAEPHSPGVESTASSFVGDDLPSPRVESTASSFVEAELPSLEIVSTASSSPDALCKPSELQYLDDSDSDSETPQRVSPSWSLRWLPFSACRR